MPARAPVQEAGGVLYAAAPRGEAGGWTRPQRIRRGVYKGVGFVLHLAASGCGAGIGRGSGQEPRAVEDRCAAWQDSAVPRPGRPSYPAPVGVSREARGSFTASSGQIA
jgi:hypothetical protein